MAVQSAPELQTYADLATSLHNPADGVVASNSRNSLGLLETYRFRPLSRPRSPFKKRVLSTGQLVV